MARPTSKLAPQVLAGTLVDPKRSGTDDLDAIVSSLEEAGVLSFLRALLEERTLLMEQLVTKLDSEPTKRGLKNGVTLLMALGALPEGVANSLAATLNAGLRSAEKAESSPEAEKMSIWILMGMLKNPDVARAIHYLMGFLEGMGQHLGEWEKAR